MTAAPLSILHLDDSDLDATLVAAAVEHGGVACALRHVDGRRAFEEALRAQRFDLILLDYSMPQFSGLEALDLVVRDRPETPVIFVSGTIGEDMAVETLKRGARDYVLKHQLFRLVPAIRRALDEVNNESRRREAERQLRELNRELEQRVAERTRELMEKNREMEADLVMAHDLQQALLPQFYPTFPPQAAPEASLIRFAHRYVPAQSIGGDFFDIMALSNVEAGVLICDVMGHGVRSALLTALICGLFRDLPAIAAHPEMVLSTLNRALVLATQHVELQTFVTAFYFTVNARTREIVFACAGHPRPLRIRRSPVAVVEALDFPAGIPGPPLGIEPDSEYAVARTRLAEGETLFLFTDGIYETTGPGHTADFGMTRLLDAVRRRTDMPMDALLGSIVEEARQFSAARQFEDDVCLLSVELK
jgi:serine phosphatase RsbU (regulator of sigma subunit)